MHDNLLDRLKQENDQLAKQAFYDGLTGILNRRATEQRITEQMKRGGMLLIGDLDRFKSINDRYGHLEGDRCLKQAATLLKHMIREYDILGRIGGDEFVIFMPNCTDHELIERLSQNIEDRFSKYSDDQDDGIRLSITISGAICRPGETYEQLFDRADQRLIAKKERRRAGVDDTGLTDENWMKDIEQIRQDLIEEIRTPGAYCQDYETFKSIYRFLERGMLRQEMNMCTVLFSLVGEDGQTMDPNKTEQEMKVLGSVLQSSMRLGDVYTRYSSCQYLILLINVSEELAGLVAERIKRTYDQRISDSDLLIHYCYQLEPAKILK